MDHAFPASARVRRLTLLLTCLLAACVAAAALAAHARAADPVRDFDGVDDAQKLHTPATAAIDGAITIAALVRPDALGARSLVAVHDDTASATGYDFRHTASGTLALGVEGTYAHSSASPAPLATGTWQLAVVTKAAGTATPRFHVYDFATDTWIHQNATSTLGVPVEPAHSIRLGDFQNTARYDGRYAAAGIYSRALTDIQVESLSGSYPAWLALSPAAMWILNQRHETHPVLDETGGRASERWDTTSPAVVANSSPLDGDPDSMVLLGDLSRGDFHQWLALLLEGATARGTVETSSPPAGESHYGRYTLRAGDVRAQPFHGLQLGEGSDVYARFLLRFGSGFPVEPGWGQLFFELHSESSTSSPPVALYVTSSGRLQLAGIGIVYWNGPSIDTLTWHEYVVRVKHSSNRTIGFVELWRDGVKQTLANGSQRMYAATLADAFNYPLIGYYRDSSMRGTGTVDVAGFRLAWRLADVLP